MQTLFPEKEKVVKLAFRYIDKVHINPSEAPKSVKSELAKINKGQDDIIRFIRHYEEEQLNPMIRVTNSIALRFDVIGKTLETLMDKQLMKTTVNDELSSEKNMPERKSVLRQENYLIIPLKTFFGDTLGGGYAFAFCSKPIHNKYDSKFLRCLPHCRIVFNDIIRYIYRSFFDIILQGFPP